MEVVRDGQAEEVATNGKQRWPLSPSTTLRVTMSQASAEASSDKVPRLRMSSKGEGSGNQGRGSSSVTQRRQNRTCATLVTVPFLASILKEQKEAGGLHFYSTFSLTP